MTIVTKPLSEKKNDTNQEPLVDAFKVDVLGEPERCTRPSIRLPPFREIVRERRGNTASTACLFFTALIVMSCGITIGLYLYSQLGQFMQAKVRSGQGKERTFFLFSGKVIFGILGNNCEKNEKNINASMAHTPNNTTTEHPESSKGLKFTDTLKTHSAPFPPI